MSFLDQGSMKAMPAIVLLPGFQARGTLQVLGMVQTFLNDEQKSVFGLKDVALHGLETGNPAASMQLESLFIPKERCQVVAFETTLSQEQTGLMPRVEQIAAYTSHFVIQGEFHMGADTVVGDVIDSVRVMFLGVTNAQFFPLFRPQAAMIQQAPLVYVYRKAVQMFHMV